MSGKGLNIGEVEVIQKITILITEIWRNRKMTGKKTAIIAVCGATVTIAAILTALLCKCNKGFLFGD